MNSFPCSVPLGALKDDVMRLEYHQDASGIDMAALQGSMPKWLKDSPAIRMALNDVPDAQSVMVNRLKAGVEVPVHTDAENGVRWHLPIVTNPGAMWWDEISGQTHMEAGFWWGPVPYTIPHKVLNRGATDRIHLVVDIAKES